MTYMVQKNNNKKYNYNIQNKTLNDLQCLIWLKTLKQ